MLKKVACNTTNSAAIDEDGGLWVWGSCRYGLCGDTGQSEGGPTKQG
jgi:alpha-tubulin suppressor-like RCC1 family protein